jgi:hypothetical protein
MDSFVAVLPSLHRKGAKLPISAIREAKPYKLNQKMSNLGFQPGTNSGLSSSFVLQSEVGFLRALPFATGLRGKTPFTHFIGRGRTTVQFQNKLSRLSSSFLTVTSNCYSSKHAYGSRLCKGDNPNWSCGNCYSRSQSNFPSSCSIESRARLELEID